MKHARLSVKTIALWLIFCTSGGALLSWLFGLPTWGGAAIIGITLITNGYVAEFEDRAPGGFLNPHKKHK
jgi:hypothetical protein